MDSSNYLALQVKTLQTHDAALQKLFFEKTGLKKDLPTIPSAMGYKCTSSPYAKPESIDKDDEELEEAAQTLGNDCMDLLRKNIPPSPLTISVAVIATTPTAKCYQQMMNWTKRPQP